MHRVTLPVGAVPAWSLLNNVEISNVKIVDIPGRGCGLVCREDLLTGEDTVEPLTLVAVPHSLVLGSEAVEEYAKEDVEFRQLLDAAGHESTRGDILLFLLVQLVSACRKSQGLGGACVSNPWTEYTKFLPQTVPVPTVWTEQERQLLCGTSLEPAVHAKLSALNAEFDALREASSEIPHWNEVLWLSGDVSLKDWVVLDAIYRSRCLELPRSGEAMVPCIDMANHAGSPNAYYEENSEGEVALLVRPNVSLTKGEEVVISYGEKSAAEMLFSYGFVDTTSTAQNAVFPLTAFHEDPLAKAKLAAFGDIPKIQITQGASGIGWESPFAYLMCVNEEDGLEFQLLQDRDGHRQLKLFWQGDDVTGRAADFETLVQDYALCAVIRLRVVTIVQESLQAQVERMASPPPDPAGLSTETSPTWESCVTAASLLKTAEISILGTAIEAMELEKLRLMEDESVIAYLSRTETAEAEMSGEEEEHNSGDVEMASGEVSNSNST